MRATYSVLFRAMASQCEIRLDATTEAAAGGQAQAAIDEVLRIESKYSRYRPDSVVSRISAQAGQEAVECDDETLLLLMHAERLFQQSDGLFDITSGVLRKAWDFRLPSIPSDKLLSSLCLLVGWSRVERDGRQVRLPSPGMELDFGGFGKEYAADRAAAVLLNSGVRHGFVNLAGDIRVLGPKPDGQPWMMGIQNPRQPGKLVASIPMQEGALATSGDYERYFELAGRRYCHILNPLTGRPVEHWRSVSVISPTALASGGYSTITMLKEANGQAFLEGSGLACLAIDKSGRLFSKGGRH
jgi:thiamine biosynthesis lipoprotein